MLGVRVNAPYRGDHVSPWVRVQVEWYSSDDGAWHPADGGDSGWFRAGGAGASAWTGYTFPFAAPSPGHQLVMRAVATIDWRGSGAAAAMPPAQAVTPICQLHGA